jgi:hypothetical protein
VNLLKNSIAVEQAQELVKIMQSKEKLNTLCGLSGNEATLDFSAQGLRPGDAVLIANDISNMRVLTSLDVSNNSLVCTSPNVYCRNMYSPGDMVEYGGVMCPVERASPDGGGLVGGGWYRVYLLHGVLDLTDAIRVNGAMMSLNLASNGLGAAGAKIVAAFLPKCT